MSESKISATVNAPEGLPPIRALLSVTAKTQTEFDAVVEAVGGACAFTYYSDYSAHATIADDVTLILSPPDSTSYTRPLPRSIQALKDACPR